MTAVGKILVELRVLGVRIEPRPHGGVRLIPARLIDPDLFNRIRRHKSALLAHLCAEQKTADISRVARADGWKPLQPDGHSAYSILTTCQHAGVALRIDPEKGDLVVGRAGAKADEPTQPWVDLVRELEAHVEAVATLVEAGWTLTAEFPKEVAV